MSSIRDSNGPATYFQIFPSEGFIYFRKSRKFDGHANIYVRHIEGIGQYIPVWEKMLFMKQALDLFEVLPRMKQQFLETGIIPQSERLEKDANHMFRNAFVTVKHNARGETSFLIGPRHDTFTLHLDETTEFLRKMKQDLLKHTQTYPRLTLCKDIDVD